MRRGVCKNILFDSAMNLINNYNVIVIDVRDEREAVNSPSKLPGSINIPISQLTAKIASIVPNKDTPIIVYCSTGSRSIFACQILADYGYNRVYNLYGGTRNYNF